MAAEPKKSSGPSKKPVPKKASGSGKKVTASKSSGPSGEATSKKLSVTDMISGAVNLYNKIPPEIKKPIEDQLATKHRVRAAKALLEAGIKKDMVIYLVDKHWEISHIQATEDVSEAIKERAAEKK